MKRFPLNNIYFSDPCEISLVPRDTGVYFEAWNSMTIWFKWAKFLVMQLFLNYPSYPNRFFFHIHLIYPLISILYFAILILIMYQLFFTLLS